jgi:hypothetical protein
LIPYAEEKPVGLQLNENWFIPYAEEKPASFSSGSASFFPEISPKKVIVINGAVGYGKSSFFHTLLEHLKSDIFHFSVHGEFTKLREKVNLSWKPQIKFDDEFDNWIASDEALLLFRSSHWLLKNNRSCKSRISHTIYSSKYLHKYLLKVLLDKFPNKNVNNCYGLPFHYSPHQLQFSQHNRWIWCLKLSLTIALGIKPGYDPKIVFRT